jgi:hypothetical protein
MKKSDLLWIFAYPIYQVVGTIRHEGSHALAGYLEGLTIKKFVFLPYLRNGHLIWGHVDFNGSFSWLTIFAPYLCDLITFLIVFFLCLLVSFRQRWVWLNLIALGIISPFANSLYNYLGGFSSNNDVGYLLTVLPRYAVHVYFICTLCAYVVGFIIIFSFSRTAMMQNSPHVQAGGNNQ